MWNSLTGLTHVSRVDHDWISYTKISTLSILFIWYTLQNSPLLPCLLGFKQPPQLLYLHTTRLHKTPTIPLPHWKLTLTRLNPHRPPRLWLRLLPHSSYHSHFLTQLHPATSAFIFFFFFQFRIVPANVEISSNFNTCNAAASIAILLSSNRPNLFAQVDCLI